MSNQQLAVTGIHKKSVSRILRAVTLWLWGGFIYYIIEITARGHSHPSMFIVGGVCFLLIGGLNNFLPWKMGLVKQAMIGAAVVTGVEFISGCVLNLWLGLGVWDYSQMPLNVLGQVCLPYCVIWFGLSFVGIWLDDFLRWKLYGEETPRYKVW